MDKFHRFPSGKIPSEILKRVVFTKLGVPSNRVIQGPNIGEDAAVIDMGKKVLIVATDPVTGALEDIGWLAVNINANDVACTGAKPLWFLCVTLLPEESGEELLKKIFHQIHLACSELGVTLIGGHTESTPRLERPIIIGVMIGEALKNKYVTTGGALPGDSIVLTKSAGIEGTAILAKDLYSILKERVDEDTLKKAQGMLRKISVVPEAMIATKIGVNSLHDPTEGGLINGLWEMSEAAEVGVAIWEETIFVQSETKEICRKMKVDPFKLMSSGSLLITVEKEKTDSLLSALQETKIDASIIGEVKQSDYGRILHRRDGKKNPIEAVNQDEIYRILAKYKF